MTSKDFDKLLEEYFERFGDNYPLVITDLQGTEFHAKKIRECIESGKPAPEPRYEEDADY